MQPKSTSAEQHSLFSLVPREMAYDDSMLLTDYDVSSHVGHLRKTLQGIEETGLQCWFDLIDSSDKAHFSAPSPSMSCVSLCRRHSSSGLIAINSALRSSPARLDRLSSMSFSEFREGLSGSDLDDTDMGCDVIDDEPNEGCEGDQNDEIAQFQPGQTSENNVTRDEMVDIDQQNQAAQFSTTTHNTTLENAVLIELPVVG